MAQLKAFQDKVGNKNATLGQYMNAQRGLTARKGGANDPSVIQKSLKSGEKAYNPSDSTSSSAPKSFTSDTIPGSAAAPVPSELTHSSASSSETASFKGRMIPPSESGLSNTPSSPEDVKKQYGTPADLQRDIESKKTPMKESVVIGDNKYRIV